MERSEEPSELGLGLTLRPRTSQQREGCTATSTERPVTTGPHRKVSSKDLAGPLHTPFQAGRLKLFTEERKRLISDEFILDMVRDVEIPISDLSALEKCRDRSKKNQVQGNLQKEVQGNLQKEMDAEAEKLLQMGVIEELCHKAEEVISVFLVKKVDGSHRMISNLKKFNESVKYEHLKMENLSASTQMMKHGCFMASVDLRHTYYSNQNSESF